MTQQFRSQVNIRQKCMLTCPPKNVRMFTTAFLIIAFVEITQSIYSKREKQTVAQSHNGIPHNHDVLDTFQYVRYISKFLKRMKNGNNVFQVSSQDYLCPTHCQGNLTINPLLYFYAFFKKLNPYPALNLENINSFLFSKQSDYISK